MSTLLLDLRYSIRILLKQPAFTLIAVLTLTLGIGATTAIFSVARVIVINPFPYLEANRLFIPRQTLPKIGVKDQLRLSGPEYADLSQSQVFEKIAGWEPVSRNLTGGDQPERVAAAKVSANFFPLLGVEPILGRVVLPEDVGPKGERVLVIGQALWEKRFGGESSALGQTVSLDDESYTIIGVMPSRFRFDGAEAWFPFPFEIAQQSRSNRFVAVIGRLKAETTTAQANAELEVLARQQEQSYIASNPEYAGRSYSLLRLSEFAIGMVETAVLTLMGAVALVLLIACSNIANLLLARAMNRSNEIAIRAALGASRVRLIRQMMTESVVLALAGGAGGVLLAVWGSDALVALIPEGSITPGLTFGVSGTVLLFALATSLLTALIFGLWPALRASKAGIQETLKSGGQKATASQVHQRAQKLLVVTEVSLSLVLLVMAGLMIRSVAKLVDVDTGMRIENVLSMRVNRSPSRSDGGKQMAPFFQQVIDHVKSVPGVQGVAVASHAPFVYTEDWTMTVDSASVPAELRTQSIDSRTVSDDYFRVMGIPLLEGEHFAPPESPDQTAVVIINQALAVRYWPEENPVGKRLKLGQPDSKSPWFTVKGVVADSAQQALDRKVKPEAYFVLSQLASRYRRMNLMVRTSGEPKALLGAIQQKVYEVDKDQPVYQVQSMEELVSNSVGARRVAMTLLMIFAGLAMVLAFVGIYGVMSYGVTQRTHEIGIRMALGAERVGVIRLILRQGMTVAAAGVAIGIAAAFGITRFMSSLLFEVGATDTVTFAAITAALLSVAFVACYIPARRATGIDPMAALRYE
jgi:putative ABC transport system permease protein